MNGSFEASVKASLAEIVGSPDSAGWRGRWFRRLMVVLVLANVAAIVLETVRELAATHEAFFHAFELFSVAVFTLEYMVRLWIRADGADDAGASPGARLRYAATPLMIVDLMAFLPFFVGLVISIDPSLMRVLRLLRLLKVTRYSPALESFGAVLKTERRSLGAALLIILTLLVFASSLVYFMEREAQPEAFASIPQAMWWALATLTTVGYGDVTPVTAGGKAFGAFIMVLGIGMFALPTGILATGFARELRKREFMATWRLVASSPLFANLDALRISEVAALLHPRKVPPGYTVVRQGDRAKSMYFIASGEVAVDVQPTPQRLVAGDFFGEIALMTVSERTATVIAITECQLLVLNVDDFQGLLDADPELRERLDRVMKERLESLGKDGG